MLVVELPWGGHHDNPPILAKRHKPYNGNGGGERRVTSSSLALRVLMLLNNRKVTFIFRCPHTGRDVQAWSEADFKSSPAYEPVACLACLSVHLVDPETGQVLGHDNDK
jgi:hypothetical protein